jgi:hypothetical protein
MKMCPYFLHLLSYLDEIRYKRPALTAVGHADGCMEGRTLMGTHEDTLMRVLCNRIDWKIKNALFEPVCCGTKSTITLLHHYTFTQLHHMQSRHNRDRKCLMCGPNFVFTEILL